MPLKSRPKRQTSTPRAEENKTGKNATLKSLPPKPGQNARRERQGPLRVKKEKEGGAKPCGPLKQKRVKRLGSTQFVAVEYHYPEIYELI